MNNRISAKNKKLIRKKFRKVSANDLAKEIGVDSKAVAVYIKPPQPDIDPKKKVIFSISQ